MKDWTLSEAQQRLDEVVRQAESCGPQRITGSDGDVFVLSADDYERYVVGFTFPCDEEEVPEGEPMSFVEFMRNSPLAEAMAAGEIDAEEWDRACRIGR